MKYPLNPKERIGLIAISLLILANIGWLLARRTGQSGLEQGDAAGNIVVLPADTTGNDASPADTSGIHRTKPEKDRKGRKKKTRAKTRPQRQTRTENAPSPRDFLRDTIPTRR